MSDLKEKDIRDMLDILDNADVPKYGRELHYVDNNGDYAIKKIPRVKECWIVTKQED